jgi:predicted NBD/HSP70 family sugar kinase
MMKDMPEPRSPISNSSSDAVTPAKATRMLLRLLRATQPVSRVELASRLGVHRSTVTEIFKPLIASGMIREDVSQDADGKGAQGQGRPAKGLIFNSDKDYFIGVNIGVRHSQVGLTTLSGEILVEDEFVTPKNSGDALKKVREKIEEFCTGKHGENRSLRTIGVSVPGPTDADRRILRYAPHLDWNNIRVADELSFKNSKFSTEDIPLVVENDSTAAAMYEARLKIRASSDGLASDFILVRSGTGIGVGLVMNNEVYRGTGRAQGIAGEFGHMTIVAGGKPCVCGNRGCWEKYASAAAAASLFTGDRAQHSGVKMPRFVEIVAKAEGGDVRARRTLESMGEYLGIGIANVIMGIGVPHVIVSGRLVYGWKFIQKPLNDAIKKSIVGKIPGWIVECGEPKGSALGGALEVAVEEFINRGLAV